MSNWFLPRLHSARWTWSSVSFLYAAPILFMTFLIPIFWLNVSSGIQSSLSLVNFTFNVLQKEFDEKQYNMQVSTTEFETGF